MQNMRYILARLDSANISVVLAQKELVMTVYINVRKATVVANIFVQPDEAAQYNTGAVSSAEDVYYKVVHMNVTIRFLVRGIL